MKNYILIAYPRTGTSWLGGHFIQYYGKSNYLGEFFSEVYDEQSYIEKVSFLEKEREINGEEYYIKYMLYQIKDIEQYYPNWFDTFYKNFKKIKLLNKNVWRIFLSQQYQLQNHKFESNSWKIPDYKLKQFSINLNQIKKFVKDYSDFFHYDKHNILFDYDKIDDDYMMKYLGTKTFRKRNRYIHDYESFLLSDIDLIKDNLKKEFQKYNIELLDNGKIL